MDERDAAAFAGRDWEAIERLKTDYWRERQAIMTPDEALAIAEQLRLYVKSIRPDWPSEADRDANLEDHIRLADALYHASKQGPR